MDQFASHAAVEKVHDLESFLAFLEVLKADWETSKDAENTSPSSPYSSMYGWENTSIGAFLEAAIEGARATRLGQPDGSYSGQNSWRQAAAVILLGKIYE